MQRPFRCFHLRVVRELVFLWCVFASWHSSRSLAEPHWSQFRGPAGQGHAEAVSVPDRFGPDQHLLWKTPLPSGVSSPCVWGERVFVTAFDEARRKLETVCLNLVDGSVRWRRDAPADEFESVHRDSSPASGTPVADADRVYVYFGSYGMLCYTHQGDEVWSKPLDPVENRWGMGTSPILAEGRLILACDQGGVLRNGKRSQARSYLLAMDPATGETRWKVDRTDARSGWSTPVLFRGNGQAATQLVVYGSSHLAGHELESGERLWTVDQMPQDAVAIPAVGSDMVFVSGTVFGGDVERPFSLPSHGELVKKHDANGDGQLTRDEIPATSLDPRGRQATLTLKHVFDQVDRDKNGVVTYFEWTAARFFVALTSGVRGTGRKDGLVAVRPLATGEAEVAWSFHRGIPDNPSPLLYEGRIYLTKSGGIVSCIDAETGELIKRRRISARGSISASPVVGSGRLFVCSERGDMVVLDADETLKERAHNRLDGRIMATPALAGDRFLVRTDEALYAFGDESRF